MSQSNPTHSPAQPVSAYADCKQDDYILLNVNRGSVRCERFVDTDGKEAFKVPSGTFSNKPGNSIFLPGGYPVGTLVTATASEQTIRVRVTETDGFTRLFVEERSDFNTTKIIESVDSKKKKGKQNYLQLRKGWTR